MKRKREKWQGTKGKRLREDRNRKKNRRGRLARVVNTEADDDDKTEKQLSFLRG